jgi:hypothetical protein
VRTTISSPPGSLDVDYQRITQAGLLEINWKNEKAVPHHTPK